MPKRKTTFSQGHYYHIYNRGAAQRSIFYAEEEYRRLLTLVEELLPKLQITMIAYCLMPNHYHWFVRQDGLMPVRLLAQKVWKSYANSFNHKNGRHGALFEDRFKDVPVDEDDYRRDLCCYIHRNPVEANFAAAPGLWAYSNYLDCIGQRPGTLVDHAFINTYFGGAAAYQRLIEAPSG